MTVIDRQAVMPESRRGASKCYHLLTILTVMTFLTD